MRPVLAVALLAGAGCSLAYSLDGYSGADERTPNDAGSDGTIVAADASDAAPDAVPQPDADAGTSAYADAVLADQPAAYYRFEETSLGPAVDSSGKGHAGSYVGTVVFGAAGALVKETSRAIRLDGTTGWVRLGDILHFAARAPMTLEAWAKPDLLDMQYRGIITNEPPRASGKREGYLLWNHATDGLGVERFGDGGGGGQGTNALPAGKYSHVVVTYDGTVVILFVDGQETTRFDSKIELAAPSDSVLAIGARTSGLNEYFAGSLDEVAIYDHVIPPSRVLRHYEIGAGL